MRCFLAVVALLAARMAAAHPCEASVVNLRVQVEAREVRVADIRKMVNLGLLSGDRVLIAAAQQAAISLRAEEAILVEERARLGRNEDRCQELVWAEQAANKTK